MSGPAADIRHMSTVAVPGRVWAARPLPSAVTLAVLGWATFSVALLSRAGGELGVLRIDDLGQLLSALAAAAGTGWAAWRSRGRLRLSWTAICAATSCWAGGQLVWCYYELVGHRATPFPSVADAGYLLFPLGAALGLWLFPAVQGPAARRRWLLDACTVVTALIAVSWSTVLGAIAHAGGDSRFAFAVSLAYPIGDILILTMALSGVARPSRYRRQLILLSVAMSAMAVADSSFAYLNATGSYHTGSPSDLGWVASFLMLAVAGVYSATSGTVLVAAEDRQPSRPAAVTMLPYFPLLLATVVLSVRWTQGQGIDGVELVTVSAALLLILLRQYTTIRENRGLLDEVAAREADLHRQAFHDQLTGLANRALFLDRVTHALQLHRRDLRPLAVLFCDLDDFKTVNDSLGHGAGDALLVRVADRLLGTLRPGDTLARLGGDEFAVLLEDGGEPVAVAARIVDSLHEPFALAGTVLTVRASIGISELLAEQATPTVDALLSQADIAMYAAKRSGKGQLAKYEPTMVVPNTDDLQLRQPLAEAIATGQLSFVYQPIIQLDTGDILGLETLARWTHHGVAIPPDLFIPIAARAGLLGALTDQALEAACSQLSDWSSRLGHHRLRIGVNIPPLLVNDLDFPDRVGQVLRRTNLRPEQLVLEITEEALLEDPQTVAVVAHRLRELGVRLSLDDFGKGYSSLLHLQKIPLQSLKIDQGFIAGIDEDPAAERFVAALLRLGRDLGLLVIAEGIERVAQADILAALGCPLAQGYYFRRPASAVDIEQYLFDPTPKFVRRASASAGLTSADHRLAL